MNESSNNARTTLGDLAHSLKTPLAVISGAMRGLSERSPDAGAFGGTLQTVNEQVSRMSQLVTWQLQRIVRTAESSSLGKSVRVAAAILILATRF